MAVFQDFGDRLVSFFTKSEGIQTTFIPCILEFLLLAVLFYFVFKVLTTNKCAKFIAAVVVVVIVCGFTLSLSSRFDAQLILMIVLIIALLVFTMFHTEIKRSILDAGVKKGNAEKFNVTGIELIIEEAIRAIQNMSKKDIGALIVLSNDNLPEGIIESGTIVNAEITSQMIEAVFYPKAPLHDGAMIIEGNKIYAAGCFLPLTQSDNLPKEMGSRHRAALGVTTVANVTAIVVSEETGIISIVRNGMVIKKYADAADLKNALSDYYWSDLTAENKI